MAGVFGKDPNMKRGEAELERIQLERRQKQALAAQKFNKKKPAAAPPSKTTDSK